MQNNRAEYSYIRDGKAGISTAFKITDKGQIKLNIPRALGATTTVLDVYSENGYDKLTEITGEWSGIDGKYDSYIFEINTKDLGTGLYFLRPRLSLLGGELLGHRWAGGIFFDYNSDPQTMMQMTVCDFSHAEPRKIRGGVIYHISSTDSDALVSLRYPTARE